jgi:hypothetical protein
MAESGVKPWMQPAVSVKPLVFRRRFLQESLALVLSCHLSRRTAAERTADHFRVTTEGSLCRGGVLSQQK